ncbi:MAG: helix-turn-helix transcriptional regulator [Candidatus Ornithomonoglobus sp.]
MNKLKEKRQAVGMTQASLAAEMQVDRTTVVKWEKNEAFPRADKLPKLAEMLHCTIDELYDNETVQEEVRKT